MVSQKDIVLKQLKERGTLTVRDIFLLGINSPRKVISDLREKVQIDDFWIAPEDGGAKYKGYRLHDKQ